MTRAELKPHTATAQQAVPLPALTVNWHRLKPAVQLLLCLALLLAPLILSRTHGPGVYADGLRAEAALAQHGHAHALDMVGGHNAADHDHSSMAVPVSGADPSLRETRRATIEIPSGLAEGRAGEGPRRPPRGAVL